MATTTTTLPIRVAIADDHVRYRSGIKLLLSGKKDIHMTAEASDGQELLNIMENLPVDVILLDIRMPVLDGISTLPLIRKRFPAAKVIMLSMHNEHHLINELMELGAHAYLSKTADGEIIYQTIMTMGEGNSPGTEL